MEENKDLNKAKYGQFHRRRLTDRFLPEEFDMLRERFSHLYIVEGECWIWPHYKDEDGYGVCTLRGKTYRVHQVVYELFVGDIPDGFCLLHSCDRRACLRISHIHIGTHEENMKEMVLRGRSLRGDRNAQAKLSWADVRLIRSLATRGVVLDEISQQFPQVQRRHIARIIKGDLWREGELSTTPGINQVGVPVQTMLGGDYA